MPKVDSFRMVATMLSLCLPLIGMVIDVEGKFTPTCQGIVMFAIMYRSHTPPCICFFCLILIHGNIIQMYACLIYKYCCKYIYFSITLCYAPNTRKWYLPNINNHVCLTARLYGISSLD